MNIEENNTRRNMARINRKHERIQEIENEFDCSIDELLKDFAKEHSYSFTCGALELHHRDLKEYKQLFKPRKIKQGSIEVTERASPIMDKCEVAGISYSAYLWRKKHWPSSKWFLPKQKSGGVENFKGKRNNKAWKQRINKECQLVIESRK